MCLHTERYREKKVINFNDSELKGKIAVHSISSRAGRAMVYRITGFMNSSVLIVDNLSIAPKYSKETGQNLEAQLIPRQEHLTDRIIYSEAIMEEMRNNNLETKHLSKYKLKICLSLKSKR